MIKQGDIDSVPSDSALTTALFLGRSYFDDPRHPEHHRDSGEAILEATYQCDLTDLDDGYDWVGVSTLAKNFIKELLVLNETKRLKVGQALRHPWFTIGGRGQLLKQEYEKAIQGWAPAMPKADFKEDLDVFMQARTVKTDVSAIRVEVDVVLTPGKSQLMPPPPKPNITKRRHMEEMTTNQDNRSPHFHSLKECDPPSSWAVSSSSRAPAKDGEDYAKENFVWEDAEYNLREEVSQERRGWRSAKSFGESIKKRRRL